MRVAIVQETVDVSRGGAETSTLEMARRLVEQGADVTVVCRAQPGIPERDDAGVQFHGVEAGGSRASRAVSFVRGADEHCIRENYDVVHAITPCFTANVYQPRGGTYVETVARNIALERSLLRKAIKWIDRRLNWRQRFLTLMEREMLSDARAPVVAAVSSYVQRQVLDAFPITFERVRVVFNGVDIQPLEGEAAADARRRIRGGLGVADDETLALFVAHNFKLKGLRELLLACVSLKDAAPRLAIAGNGDRRAYERLARRGGISDRVMFVESQAEMAPFYAAADLLAHPTWYDPCSRVVLEALSCGLPVVTTECNGASEVVEEGVHGCVVKSPGDIRALADALRRCAAEEVRAACRAEAPAFRKFASMERHARELIALYQTLPIR